MSRSRDGAMVGGMVKSEGDLVDERVVSTFRSQLRGRGEAGGGRDGSMTVFHYRVPFVSLKSQK